MCTLCILDAGLVNPDVVDTPAMRVFVGGDPEDDRDVPAYLVLVIASK